MKTKLKSIWVKTCGLGIVVQFFYNSFLSAQPFPPFTATVFDTVASVGYYFFSPKLILSISGIAKETQMILDRNGELVYYHEFPQGTIASDFKIQSNGLMTYNNQEKFFIMDSTFTTIDSIEFKNGVLSDGHEFLILPNGHYIYIGLEKDTMDLSSYHIFKGNNIPGGKNAIVISSVIQEQDVNKNVVFEWHSKNYYAFDDIDPKYLYDTNLVDWTHTNSIEIDYDGNLLISTRQFNEITKINKSDSTIMWRLGGLKNQFVFINDSAHFRVQHDARRLPNGNLTVFDNGFKIPPHPVSAKEYQIDEVQKTATLVWCYMFDSIHCSKSRGNMQRLSNGNTVVGYGRIDSLDIVFNCVNPLGKPIFEVRSYDSIVTYRAFNYPVLPWNINRPKIKCEKIGGQVFLSVDSGLSSYHWNTGDTTFKIAVTGLDTFNVFVPRGSGGFIKSENFIVSGFSNPCNLSSISDADDLTENFTLRPNPADDKIYIQSNYLNIQKAHIEIFDIRGKRIYNELFNDKGQLTVPLSGFDSGFYFVRINGQVKKFIKT